MAQGAVRTGMTISIIEEQRGKQPPDLTDEQWDHGSSDAEVFAAIKRALPPTMMPGFDGRIPDRNTAAYSSILAADVQGVRTLLTFTATAGVGVRASDGKLMFRYPNAANNVANVATPVYSDNKVFFASAYGTGGGLLNLTVQNGEVAATEAYFTREMKNHHGGMVLVGGYLYGYNDLILTCLEFATGKMMWRDRSVGKGSVTYADGHLYVQSENNVVGLAEATSSGYREKGRFEIPDKGLMSWAHPASSDGRLYVRNQDRLLVYDITAKS
jgi:outer membrane protein assembly factor BamB